MVFEDQRRKRFSVFWRRKEGRALVLWVNAGEFEN